MLTCIACSKQLGSIPDPDDDDDAGAGTPSTRHAIRTLTAQIKDMAMKASGAYRHCKPCSGSAPPARRHHHPSFAGSDSAVLGSDRIQCGYQRAGDSSESTPSLFPSGDGSPAAVTLTEAAEERKEWVAQVEPGVLITFLSAPEGGNDLKRIRFSREIFDKWQAQRWWAENYDKVMELYNVQRFNRQAVPLPTPPRSEGEGSKIESAKESPVTPPLSKERPPTNFHRPEAGRGIGYSSSESLDHQPVAYRNIRQNGTDGRYYYESRGHASTPKLSSISGVKTETSSVDAASMRTSSESGELSVSAASSTSEQETEWVEQDEPGVYITIRALPGGTRELRRVRFSRERFGEMHARLWWEENRARIHQQYL